MAIKAAPFNRYLTLDVARAAALSNRGDEIALYTGNDDNIVVDIITEYKFNMNSKVYKMYPHLAYDDFVKENLERWLAD